jgi:hypothetical protein
VFTSCNDDVDLIDTVGKFVLDTHDKIEVFLDYEEEVKIRDLLVSSTDMMPTKYFCF